MKEDTAVDTVIQDSCNATRALYDLLLNVQQSLQSSNNTTLARGIRSMQQLHLKMKQLDQQVDRRIKAVGTLSVQQKECLFEKKQLQQEIFTLQKSLVPQINNIKSTLASEMSSIKTGRSALKGYGSISKGPGRVINKSL